MADVARSQRHRSKHELVRAVRHRRRKLVKGTFSKTKFIDWRDVLTRKRPVVFDEEYQKSLRPE